MVAVGESEAEIEKRIGAALMAGDSCICVDNVVETFFSPFLCIVLTHESVHPRVLGKSKNVECPTNVLFITTGNNWTCKGDMVRRVVLIEIDPKCEDPADRRFDFDPVEHARAGRAEFLGAALTILHAYAAAGRPAQKLKNFGSFEEWSEWARAPLVWLGEPDPLGTTSRLKDDDPVRGEITAVFDAWWRAFGGDIQTVADVIAYAEKKDHEVFANAELRDALLLVAEDDHKRGTISAKRLGGWLVRYRERVFSGMKITKCPNKKNNAVQYRCWVCNVRQDRST